jgi:biotin synthase
MDDALQALCFMAGANSMFYGDALLTTANPQMEADQRLLQRLGMRVEPAGHQEAPAQEASSPDTQQALLAARAQGAACR